MLSAVDVDFGAVHVRAGLRTQHVDDLGDFIRRAQPVQRDLLFDDIVHIMPPDRFVLEILETVTFDSQVFKRCDQLRAAGFQFALDDVVRLTKPLEEALPYVDYVKVDFVAADRAHLPELAATLKRYGKTLLAEKIETHQDFAGLDRVVSIRP